ncbi:hypothetical protein HAX54_024495 [Datura stramonium]|uniref:Uncharacterized protein n=1 Tax=Datura stramonium TaxID=4076 RepID=A0ABS8V0N0_DATST|nr:hypothetical protein [Datura stramonium]
MGLLGSTHRRRLSMLLKIGLMRASWRLSSLLLGTRSVGLGLGYIFAEPEECNITLVREFYTNWDISYGERNEVKIRGQVICRVGPAFKELLDDDEATVLTDGVDDLDNDDEEEDAITGSMKVDGDDDEDEDQDYNLDDA